jgi:UDP-N-acetylmuramoyl-tripeptide--D-alanyl-D-alanine ligase
LATKFKTYATPGNLNNHIGVPLTLLKTPPDTEMLVVEMGANGPGEIAALCEIAEPDFGLITNIGKDHLEGFGSLEGVAAANSELFYYLFKHEGQVFVNTLEPHVKRMASRFNNTITYPQHGDFYHAEYVNDGQFYLSYHDEQGKLTTTNLVGAYNFANVATALCVGKYFETNPEATNNAIASYLPANNRSQIVETGQNRVILDAYNANPSSMEAAIKNFISLKTEKKALFLGDMLEMGQQSQYEHERIGILTQNPAFELVGLVGSEMKHAAEKNPKAKYFETPVEALAWLTENKLEGYTLLLKGSRGLKMEQLIEKL